MYVEECYGKLHLPGVGELLQMNELYFGGICKTNEIRAGDSIIAKGREDEST